MRTLESKIPAMKNELINLANSVSMYERYSCNYIEQLSDVNYSVLKRAYKKADTKGDLTLSKYVNTLLKGCLNKTTKLV